VECERRASAFAGASMIRPLCGAAAFAALVVMACSGGRREPPQSSAVRPLLVMRARTPVDASVTPGAGAPPLALDAFAPWLSLPDLKNAAEALEAGDVARAAHETELLTSRRSLEASDVQSYQLLLARLREAAGDSAGALASYELAASAPGPLSGYAVLGVARLLLATGHAADALAWSSKVPAAEPIAEDARLLRADAAQKTGDVAQAIALWREHLSRGDTGPEAPAISLRLADALTSVAAIPATLPANHDVEAGEALGLARRVLSRTADPVTITRAEELQARALSLLSPELRSARSRPSPEEDLERLKTLVDGKQWDVATPLADGLLARLGDANRWLLTGCEATVLRARALSGQREWTPAEEALAAAIKHCTDGDLRARALFLAGKYATSTKRYAEAAGYYERLETDYPTHRLADDARLHRALCYHEIGADARFTELLTRMPDDYPEGDMVLDGMFELALRRIEKADWASAESVLERAAQVAAPADAKRGLERAGRERYFRARARAARGDVEGSLVDYEAIVRELPLSYYMLHAYTRLFASDATRAQKALDDALALSQKDPFSFAHRPEFDLPGFVRALELLRVGDVPDATRELSSLGLLKSDAAPPVLWAVALLYARAGAAKLSHDLADGLTDWLGRWPSGDWSRAWEIAFPRPYRAVVQRESKRSSVPESLVYAVMREESSFDPAAESPVKAYGLMQLMEPTAKRFARPLGLPCDVAALKRPAVNVAIGCRVLSDLTRTFAESPLLAIPGYNAGAGRPRRWVGERPSVDFDVWVELIPFQETRRYTKRVLASRAAYAFLYAKEGAEEAMRLPVSVSVPQK
jgi:soluble lytic murein transglycosylase